MLVENGKGIEMTHTSANPPKTSSPYEMLKWINGKVDEMLLLKIHHEAPCAICGYNGKGYYQPDNHECMKREKELRDAE